MFLHLSVILFGEGLIPAWNGRVSAPGQEPPLTHTTGQAPFRQTPLPPRQTHHLPGQTPPQGDTPPPNADIPHHDGKKFYGNLQGPQTQYTKISIGQGMNSVSYLCVLLHLDFKVYENKIPQ